MKFSINKAIKRYILLRLLPKLLARKSPESIPRSGEKGQSVNCFTIYLGNKGEKPSYLVDGFNHNTKELTVLSPDETERFAIKETIALRDALKYLVRVSHYYGLYDLYYTNVYALAFNRITRYDEIRVKLCILWNRITQSRFNKKKLIIEDGYRLLRFMLERQLDGIISRPGIWAGAEVRGIDTFSLMTELETLKWLDHPDSPKEQQRLEMYLKSFVETGELKVKHGQYIVTDKALRTLEDYEEGVRRHKDATKLQVIIIFFTSLIAVGTLQQAKLIDFPKWVVILYDYITEFIVNLLVFFQAII